MMGPSVLDGGKAATHPWIHSLVPEVLNSLARNIGNAAELDPTADVAAQGAAALVLDHFLSPRPSVLLMD